MGVIPTQNLSASEAAREAEQLGVRNPSLFDLDHDAANLWGISGEPTMILLDSDGLVVREYDFIKFVTGQGLASRPTLASWQASLNATIAADLQELISAGR